MFRTLKTLAFATTVVTGLAGGLGVSSAQAQERYIGEIIMGGWNFCPRGTTGADGQLLPIAPNTALFSLYGTIYGGDGRTTFGLPDLRGRVAMHTGSGPGLSSRTQGSKGGSETNTLSVNQMPSHSHSLNATTASGNTPVPTGNLLSNDGSDRIYTGGSPDTALSSEAIGNTGAGQAVNNLQPFQVIRYCVVLQGIYPSRS